MKCICSSPFRKARWCAGSLQILNFERADTRQTVVGQFPMTCAPLATQATVTTATPSDLQSHIDPRIRSLCLSLFRLIAIHTFNHAAQNSQKGHDLAHQCYFLALAGTVFCYYIREDEM